MSSEPSRCLLRDAERDRRELASDPDDRSDDLAPRRSPESSAADDSPLLEKRWAPTTNEVIAITAQTVWIMSDLFIG